MTIATPARSARAAISGAFIEPASQPRRILTVTGTPSAATAATTASTSRSARSGSLISADPERPFVTFFAGQPKLMSMIRAPCPAHQRAASAMATGSRPASWTAVRASPAPSSARARTSRRPRTASALATISDTTRPAPRRAATVRNGRSVIPAIGARKTGGDRTMRPKSTCMCTNRKQPRTF